MHPALRICVPAACVLVALWLGLGSAQAQTTTDSKMQRNITVSASGSIDATPDMARIQSGVVTEADTAAQALQANTAAMTKLIAGLKDGGIDAKDIQTSQFRVEPRYTHSQDGRTPPRIEGYQVINDLQIVVRDIAKLGGILDTLVTLGANQMGGLSFDVSKAETLKDDARKEAMANARRRAELLAAAAGAAVGDVISISEEVLHDIGPYPAGLRGQAKMSAVPVESGSQRLEARVTVTWALK